MRSPDDLLMDRVVQPVVDRLPDSWSCFDVSALTVRIYACSMAAAIVGYATREVAGPVLSLFAVAITSLVFWSQVERISLARKSTRFLRANPYRIDPISIKATWVWISFAALSAFNELTGHWPVDPADLGTAAILISTVTSRAQPRPPGVARKAWLPGLASMVGARA